MNAEFGNTDLLKKVREICQEIEKLPPGLHQTKMSCLASDLAFAMQNLQDHGDFHWPQPLPSPKIPEEQCRGCDCEPFACYCDNYTNAQSVAYSDGWNACRNEMLKGN